MYKALSSSFAAVGFASILFWLQSPNAGRATGAFVITGLVAATATYRYVRTSTFWIDDFSVVQSSGAGDYLVTSTGAPFDDADHYVG